MAPSPPLSALQRPCWPRASHKASGPGWRRSAGAQKTLRPGPTVLNRPGVRLVANQQKLLLAGSYPFRVPQLALLGVLSFPDLSADPLFEYPTGCSGANPPRPVQHELRLEAYDNLQRLESAFFEAGRAPSAGHPQWTTSTQNLERCFDHWRQNELPAACYHWCWRSARRMAVLSLGVAGVAFLRSGEFSGSVIFSETLEPPATGRCAPKASDFSTSAGQQLPAG